MTAWPQLEPPNHLTRDKRIGVAGPPIVLRVEKLTSFVLGDFEDSFDSDFIVGGIVFGIFLFHLVVNKVTIKLIG